ncbi:MAG: hypothetical protein Q9160_008491 [Pyrenula sp. 1 TL-2023]
MFLQDEILLNLAESKFGNEKRENYLPEGCLEELITKATVRENLKYSADASEQRLLVDFIDRRAKKVFAITLLAVKNDELFQAMKQFQEHDFTDDALPVSDINNSHIAEIRQAFSDGKLWNMFRKRQFENKQWMFLAPVFTESQLIYKFKREHILPFKSLNSKIKESTFGDVFEVKIHESHQKGDIFIVNGNRVNVAVKEIVVRDSDRSTLDDVRTAHGIEAMALSKIREVKHENLIQCIAAITRGEKYYFLFPWADGGNLLEFWKSVPRPSLTPEFVRNIIMQMCGLAEALDKMHSYLGEAASSSQGRESDDSHEGRDVGAADGATPGSGGIRHGDLKPENILRFSGGNKREIGILKIADMGLAKHHDVNTRLRKNLTSTRYGTARYEPPEVGAPRLTSPATSRLYDTWSMGCILLELIIWLLYGYEDLVKFYDSVEDYYIVKDNGQVKVGEVRPDVNAYIAQLSTDKACTEHTALGDLLKIVRTKLLVVQLPPSRTTTVNENVTITPAVPTAPNATQYRATARVLCESLRDILGKAQNDDGYLYAGQAKTGTRELSRLLKPTSSGGLHPDSAQQHSERSTEAPVTESSLVLATRMGENVKWPKLTNVTLTFSDLADKPLDINVWDFSVDNDFATRLLDKLDESSLPSPFPYPAESEQLCDGCRGLNFWVPSFRIVDKLTDLQWRAAKCRFCEMRWTACSHLEGVEDRVRFDRVQSVIKMNESDPPVFFICRCRNLNTPIPIQIAPPALFPADSNARFQIMRSWLRDCNDNHASLKCTAQPAGGVSMPSTKNEDDDLQTKVFREIQARRSFKLPTRLIDVGIKDSETVKLYKTQPDDKGEDFEFIALSHPWGDPRMRDKFFLTTRDNLEAHFKQIDVKKLPDTFKDAVITTRALGIRYLWIDSLCIVQGPGGDFDSECKRMEDIFSSAYCVIAASSAKGQWDGFLKRRSSLPRDSVVFQRGSDPPFYVCRFVDDFNHDVLEGSLSQRGWVLQERALARRTIYFSGQQAYWECGAGVRCETLTKMDNQLNAFLGDPNFPEAAVHSSRSERETSRGKKILYYQDLYMRYSRLAFSEWEDRAVAMQGLEQRLIRGFKSRGGFGVLDDKAESSHKSLLGRSLLWHRGADEHSLTRITFPPDRQKAPTWSWMAYRGGIDYLRLPFDEWETEDIRSPWHTIEARTVDRAEVPELGATAREIAMGQAAAGEGKVIFDVTGKTGGLSSRILCVIIGRAKGQADIDSRFHYILLVRPKAMSGIGGTIIFERIGAGRVPGRCINLKGPGLAVRIR